ncbi:MAG TPA: hypothetical protein VMK66_16245 [Myxococcales bacterium]|nr:hypothetical protein [Myxococcales bacterium]
MEPIPVSALSPRPFIRRVILPAAHYLAIAGKGPLDQAGKAAEALLRVGEAIRLRHAAAGRNFPLPPPELLTWGSGEWKVLLRVPEIVRAAEIGAVRQRFHAERRSAARGVVLLRLEEGACLEGSAAGHGAAGISALLAARAGELGMEIAEPRHEIRRAGGPLVVRQRLVLASGSELPRSENPRVRWRRRRSRGVPASWRRRS